MSNEAMAVAVIFACLGGVVIIGLLAWWFDV